MSIICGRLLLVFALSFCLFGCVSGYLLSMTVCVCDRALCCGLRVCYPCSCLYVISFVFALSFFCVYIWSFFVVYVCVCVRVLCCGLRVNNYNYRASSFESCIRLFLLFVFRPSNSCAGFFFFCGVHHILFCLRHPLGCTRSGGFLSHRGKDDTRRDTGSARRLARIRGGWECVPWRRG